MSRTGAAGTGDKARVPRASGDEPHRDVAIAALEECSPRERG